MGVFMAQQQAWLINDRDRQIYDWLVETYGSANVEAVLSTLAIDERPYVSTLCTKLGASPPDHLYSRRRAKIEPHLREIRAILEKANGSSKKS